MYPWRPGRGYLGFIQGCTSYGFSPCPLLYRSALHVGKELYAVKEDETVVIFFMVISVG